MVLMSGLLWMMDTVILWAIGYIGFGIFLPLAVSAWIALFVSRARAAKGKRTNVFAIYSGVTGSFLIPSFIYGIVNFNTSNPGKSFGYGFMTLFFISSVLFMECLVSTICAVARGKQPPQNFDYNSMYVNPMYNNMQGGMPYNNVPYNTPNSNYPYNNYPNGSYPDGNGYDPNNNYPNSSDQSGMNR